MKVTMTEHQQGLYINAIRETGLEASARRIAGVSKRAVENTIEENPDFAEQLEDAMDCAADVLEAEARRRAVDGYEEDVYYKGEFVGTTTKYSDSLLALLLKGRRRQVFGDVTKLTGDKAEPLTITVRDVASEASVNLTPEVVREAAQAAIIHTAVVPKHDDEDPNSLV